MNSLPQGGLLFEKETLGGALIFTDSSAGSHAPIQGCYCPEKCVGTDKKGCTNRVPVFTSEYWVQLTDPSLQYLRVKKDIPTDTLLTMFGGVTLQARTQKEVYEYFTRIHEYQHDSEGEEFVCFIRHL